MEYGDHCTGRRAVDGRRGVVVRRFLAGNVNAWFLQTG